MSTKYCSSCGTAMAGDASFCPKCGMKQPDSYEYQELTPQPEAPQFQQQQPYQQYQPYQQQQPYQQVPTKNRTMSIVSLCLVIASEIIGGLFLQIPGIILAILVLSSTEYCDSGSKKRAKVSLVLGIIFMIIQFFIIYIFVKDYI